MTATVAAVTSGSRPELICDTYRRLQRMGFTDGQAANLVALRCGVVVATRPWTIRELAHLHFLRETRRVGRRWSGADDRAAATDELRSGISADRTSAHGVGLSEPAAPTGRRDGADPLDGAARFLAVLQSLAGADPTLELLRRPTREAG